VGCNVFVAFIVGLMIEWWKRQKNNREEPGLNCTLKQELPHGMAFSGRCCGHQQQNNDVDTKKRVASD
jgi:hypothetical protein